MNRANPKDLRMAMQIAHELTKAGIWFVCMPVFDSADHAEQFQKSQDRLEQMAVQAEQAQQ